MESASRDSDVSDRRLPQDTPWSSRGASSVDEDSISVRGGDCTVVGASAASASASAVALPAAATADAAAGDAGKQARSGLVTAATAATTGAAPAPGMGLITSSGSWKMTTTKANTVQQFVRGVPLPSLSQAHVPCSHPLVRVARWVRWSVSRKETAKNKTHARKG
jgi:hypothetical protein